MCGIAGEIRFGGRVDRAHLAQMSGCVAHRGPDADRSWISDDGRVGFAFRRLSIVDLSTGDQPLTNEDGSIVSMR